MSGKDTPGEPRLNPAAIVAALNRHEVRYVIIGAFAAIAQQAPCFADTEEATGSIPVLRPTTSAVRFERSFLSTGRGKACSRNGWTSSADDTAR